MVKKDKDPGLGDSKESSLNLVPSRSGSTVKMSANMRVIIRVRPLNVKERGENNRVVVDIVNDEMLVFDPKQAVTPFFYQGVQQPNKNYIKRANKELKFVFDHVCGLTSTNNEVFEIATKDMLSALMEGYNCSVFVYGATGAGKTFTMIGNNVEPGITYLTVEQLFYTVNSLKEERDFDIRVSYIEVYNENVYDLLKPSSTPLQVREDAKYGVVIAGLTLNYIKTARELLNMLENGNKNRTQHPTDSNAESSRSHAVFQVFVKMSYKTTSEVRIVKLSMIDLAGSERASASGCVGQRFKEGANINKSLLSLGNCINKLADGSNYIPYRDSKLTRILKDSLGGNCKTVMIANISPSSICYEDTYNTLKYATRAKKIQLSIQKNIVDVDVKISEYVKMNEELQKKVKELEAKLSLSTFRPVNMESDVATDKAKQAWRSRLSAAVSENMSLQSSVLSLMSRARVLALRRRLRSRAAQHMAELAHRSSYDALHQKCSEDIPREGRAVESFMKQIVDLDSKIMLAWTKWNESQEKMNIMFKEAVAEYPQLLDFVQKLQLNIENEHLKAKNDLRYKVSAIENEEIKTFTEYMRDMPAMLKKLYLILKGYNKVPTNLADEYIEVMKKAKSGKGITWSDKEEESDPHFQFISNLDLEKPHTILKYMDNKDDINSTTDATDSDVTDLENHDPSLKRKVTPFQLANNDSDISHDSLKSLDTTRSLGSAKKSKLVGKPIVKLDSYDSFVSASNDLNSTFVLSVKKEGLKKFRVLNTQEILEVRKILFDRTNTMQPVTLNHKRSKIKPPMGFGSSLARDGTRFDKHWNVQASSRNGDGTGLKSYRARDHMQAHPYSRPGPSAWK